MCLCTQYDSPTCGHSWISLSQPCGFCHDLLNCPQRQTYQTLIAPPMTCPQCNGGFGDAETMQMIQGPWGCNQMIRSNWGGSEVIPGHWGGAQLLSQHWGAQPMIPGDCYDHRLTGPYGDPLGSPLARTYGSRRPLCNDYVNGCYDDGWGDSCCDYDGWGRRGRSSHYRAYRRSVRMGPACIVM